MTGELLTEAEHRTMALTVELWNLLSREIVGHGTARAGDLRELCADIHAVQSRIMAQAAGRAYPDRYRLMGGMVGDGFHEDDEPVAEVQTAFKAGEKLTTDLPHVYLSTACLHAVEDGRPELHDYCNAMVGYQGEKRPARCKFCPAHCVCDCHAGEAATDA